MDLDADADAVMFGLRKLTALAHEGVTASKWEAQVLRDGISGQRYSTARQALMDAGLVQRLGGGANGVGALYKPSDQDD